MIASWCIYVNYMLEIYLIYFHLCQRDLPYGFPEASWQGLFNRIAKNKHQRQLLQKACCIHDLTI